MNPHARQFALTGIVTTSIIQNHDSDRQNHYYAMRRWRRYASQPKITTEDHMR